MNGCNGYGTVAAPGNDPLVITVGAMKAMGTYSRTDDQIASYSSKGPTTYDHVVKPDVVAPRNLVVSTNSRKSILENEFPANDAAGTTTGAAGNQAQPERDKTFEEFLAWRKQREKKQ